MMFEVSVEDCFHACHAIRTPDGGMEPSHWHRWRVCASFQGAELDENGVLVDFLAIQKSLRSVLELLEGANLNEHSFMRGLPASTELVARRIFEALNNEDWHDACLIRVVVHEAEGCTASFGPLVT